MIFYITTSPNTNKNCGTGRKGRVVAHGQKDNKGLTGSEKRSLIEGSTRTGTGRTIIMGHKM